MKKVMAVALISAPLLAGCAGMSDTQQRTLTGGAGGAAGGAIIGALAGNAAMGAAIGGVAGVAGGYLFDQHKKSEESAYRKGYQDGQKK
ncbi:MAG: hypothetical protein KIT00_09490 [Rhodospirillales bacterium]|nr:hypothetical protein [Rhodospirillales bacterium]